MPLNYSEYKKGLAELGLRGDRWKAWLNANQSLLSHLTPADANNDLFMAHQLLFEVYLYPVLKRYANNSRSDRRLVPLKKLGINARNPGTTMDCIAAILHTTFVQLTDKEEAETKPLSQLYSSTIRKPMRDFAVANFSSVFYQTAPEKHLNRISGDMPRSTVNMLIYVGYEALVAIWLLHKRELGNPEHQDAQLTLALPLSADFSWLMTQLFPLTRKFNIAARQTQGQLTPSNLEYDPETGFAFSEAEELTRQYGQFKNWNAVQVAFASKIASSWWNLKEHGLTCERRYFDGNLQPLKVLPAKDTLCAQLRAAVSELSTCHERAADSFGQNSSREVTLPVDPEQIEWRYFQLWGPTIPDLAKDHLLKNGLDRRARLFLEVCALHRTKSRNKPRADHSAAWKFRSYRYTDELIAGIPQLMPKTDLVRLIETLIDYAEPNLAFRNRLLDNKSNAIIEAVSQLKDRQMREAQ